MRQFILCLLALLMTSATVAGDGNALAPLQLPLRDIIGFIAFGVLGGMLVWHLRK